MDDLEVRGRQHPVRRRQGRHRLRPDQDVEGRARAPHPPLRGRPLRPVRPRERRARARREHQRAGDGVVHGHLLDARAPHRVPPSSPASRSRSAARWAAARPPAAACCSACARRASTSSMPLAGARVAVQGFGNVGSVSADLMAKDGAKIVAVVRRLGRDPQPRRPRRPGAAPLRRRTTAASQGFPGGKPLTTPIVEYDCDILVPGGAREPDHAGERRPGARPGSSPRAPTARPRPTPTRSSRRRACS